MYIKGYSPAANYKKVKCSPNQLTLLLFLLSQATAPTKLLLIQSHKMRASHTQLLNLGLLFKLIK